MYEKIIIFSNRLQKLNIILEFVANLPWIYLDKINGLKVTEKFNANHGFCVGFVPNKINAKFEFTDIKEMFKLIRKYKNGKI